MANPFSVAVYCSSSDRVASPYREAAQQLGEGLAERGWRLVFGAGSVGLMGVVARAVHARGGQVYGVIPHALDRLEVTYTASDELIRVETMRQRKALMEENSDAFIALPGGFGTLEEIVEIIVLKQLRYLDRPIVFVNTLGYWDPLITLFDSMIAQQFATPTYGDLYHLVPTPAAALEYIATYPPVARPRPANGEAIRTALE